MLPHTPRIDRAPTLPRPGRRRRSWLLLPASALALLAACGDDEPAAGAASPSAATTAAGPAESGSAAATTGAGAAGQPIELLQFTAPLLGGGTFDGTAPTERPLVFWFWAPT